MKAPDSTPSGDGWRDRVRLLAMAGGRDECGTELGSRWSFCGHRLSQERDFRQRRVVGDSSLRHKVVRAQPRSSRKKGGKCCRFAMSHRLASHREFHRDDDLKHDPFNGTSNAMARSFTMPLTISPEALVTKAKAGAEEAGVSFVGDTTNGRFEGKGMQAEYRIEGAQVTLWRSKVSS